MCPLPHFSEKDGMEEAGDVSIPNVEVKSVLNKHKRRDSWFLDDYSVNPYYGCQFACVYCYTRGGFYGRKPYELAAKINAPEVLEKELRRRAMKREYGFIALGTSTEPYMEVELELKLTRRVLKVISSYRFPVHVLTKSPLVLRDVDLLKEISERALLPPDLDGRVSGSLVTFSMSTVNDDLASTFEPGAPPPSRRLEALAQLRSEGIEAGVAFMPVIPFITDGEAPLRRGLKRAKEAGASYAFVGALTLPGGLKDTFFKLVKEKFPEFLEDFTELFTERGYPTKRYQDRLYRRAIRISREVGLRLGIQVEEH